MAGADLPHAGGLGTSVTLLLLAGRAFGEFLAATRGVSLTVAGRVRAESRVVVAASALAVGGLALAATGGPVLVVLAVAVLGLGAGHRLARDTRLAWLEPAVVVAVLPVYGWLGAAGLLPRAFAVLVPLAGLAGAALAIASSAVDVERDQATGRRSLAVALGPRGTALAVLILQAVVGVLAIGALARQDASGPWVSAAGLAALVPLVGAVLGVITARRGPSWREVAFEVQAVGLALLAVAWVNASGTAAP